MFEATGLDDAATNVSKYDATINCNYTIIVQPIV